MGSTAPGWAPKEHFMDRGSQQSPALTKHMLLKLMSSFLEILFLHKGDGEDILLKFKSSAIKGLLIVLVFFMVQLSDIHFFCMGLKTSFSPDLIWSPYFAGKHYSLRYGKGKRLCFPLVQASLPSKTSKHKKILVKGSATCRSILDVCASCEEEEANEVEELGLWTNPKPCSALRVMAPILSNAIWWNMGLGQWRFSWWKAFGSLYPGGSTTGTGAGELCSGSSYEGI